MRRATNQLGKRLASGMRRAAAVAILAALAGVAVRADRPYAPSRDYDLQNVRVSLRFDLDQRKVIGEVIHTLAPLRDGVTRLEFDSAGLRILSARVNGTDATFETREEKLLVNLAGPAKAGERFNVDLRYEGAPTAGVFFVLPDKGNPARAQQIWTQGEAENTRYYIPIYDYPNDKATSDMTLTVPADWLTVSNGRLVSAQPAPGGMKVWTWRQSLPVSTYLISFVAGEFTERKQPLRGLPVNFYVPRGLEDAIEPTFSRTGAMIDYFSQRLGVPYPWEQYAQTAVDDFVASGMENVSATTLSTRSLVHAAFADERPEAADNLVAHELAHQWFGDLVTCKDWTNTWLNEGFATFGADLWIEHQYGNDAAAYRYWRSQNTWTASREFYGIPILTRQITDSVQYVGNVYEKAGWVLRMLRSQLGDEAFFRAIRHYLESYRLQNAVTADLSKAIEESTGVSVDPFFDQWIYGAGAPRFTVRSNYDAAKKVVELSVKQTQRIQGRVGLFRVPVEVAITTAGVEKSFPIEVSQAEQTFSFPVDGPPSLVLFDKGNRILRSLYFEKTPEKWIRQLQAAREVPDRADAAQALGAINNNDAVVAALGEAARGDRFWGVRNEALRALARIDSAGARKQVLAALSNPQPWVRQVAVEEMGHFENDQEAVQRLATIYESDKSFAVRGAALQSLAQLKAPAAAGLIRKGMNTASPEDVLRAASLRAMGVLDDKTFVPALLEWAAPDKPSAMRRVAIGSLGRVEKKTPELTELLIAYLQESSFDVRYAAIYALGRRGDPAAIEPLEALLKTGQLSIGVPQAVRRLIDELKAANPAQAGPAPAGAPGPGSAAGQDAVIERLERLDRQMNEIRERLGKIESALPAVDNK